MLEIMPLLLRLLPMIVSLGSNPDIRALLEQLGKSGAVAFPDSKDPVSAASSLFDENSTKWVQTALNLRLFDQSAMEVDGVYGDRTKKEVALFQESKGLTVDGWAGPKTQEALRASLASATTPAKEKVE